MNEKEKQRQYEKYGYIPNQTGWSKANLRGGKTTTRYYILHCVNGKIHHIRKPSLTSIKVMPDKNGKLKHFKEYHEKIYNDLTHCIEKPAFVTEETIDWFYMDRSHRFDGPSVDGAFFPEGVSPEHKIWLNFWLNSCWTLFGIDVTEAYNTV